jgi:hypothetical protein
VPLMNALSSHPRSAPAQSQMLIDSLTGDRATARAELGVEPRPFTADEARQLAGPILSLLGVSLRLVGWSKHAVSRAYAWGIRPTSSSGPGPGSTRAYPGTADPPRMRAVP